MNLDFIQCFSLWVNIMGEYHLTAVSEPRFYVNNSITANAVAGYTTIQNIELSKKPTGNITGSASAT
jgi:hypothetical protein